VSNQIIVISIRIFHHILSVQLCWTIPHFNTHPSPSQTTHNPF
jgi:hypothetical protein